MAVVFLAALFMSRASTVPLPESARPRGYLGITVSPSPSGQGLHITQVMAASPADKAGLKREDRITFLNGGRVDQLDAFVKAIGDLRAGTRIKLTIVRDGKEQEMPITLGRRPDDM